MPWGGPTTYFDQISIPLTNVNDNGTESEEGYHLVNLTEPIANATEFRLFVRAHVTDIYGCHGKERNFTYNGK